MVHLNKRILVFVLFAVAAFAQSGPTVSVGPNEPGTGICNQNFVGNIFVRSEDPANGPIHVLRCTQTALRAYSWQPISHVVAATLPATCSIGDVAFDTAATAGQNWNLCTSTDTWTAVTGGGGGSGTVTSSGTPLIHQLPVWTTSTNLKGIAVGATDRPLVGQTGADPTFSKVTLTNPATGSTLTIADGKTATVNNSLTLAGTDSTTMTFPSTSATIARTDAANTFTGTQTMTAALASASTGTTQSAGDNSTKLATTAYVDSIAGGGGTVTSVGFTGGLVSVATATTTPAMTVAGTSGGVPYFSSASTWASSGALTANLPVIGGGAGAAPTVGTRSGNTTAFVTTTGTQTSGRCVEIDASGNHIASASACASGTGTVTTTGSPVSGNLSSFSGATSITSADLSGDVSTSGTLATTVTKINGTALSALATGILKNTTSTGVPSIAVAGDFPTLNQNTTGTAANLSGTPALPNGTTATSQSAADNSTKIATTAYADAAAAARGTVTSIATTSPITGGTITSTGTIACATCVTSAASLTSGQLIAGGGSQATAVTNLTGDVTTSGGVATTIAANAVTSAKTAVVNTRRTCVVDNDTQSSTALTAAQFSGHCYIPAAATIVEVTVIGGTQTLTGTAANATITGTSSVQIGKYSPSAGTTNNALLSGLLATASGKACAMSSTSQTCIDGTTSSGTITVSTTSLAAGDMVYVSAASADAAQTWYRTVITYTIN